MKENRKNIPLNSFSLVLLILFCALALVSHFVPFFPVDLYLTGVIQSIKIEGFSGVMKFISLLGNASVMPFVILIIGSVMIALKLKMETLFWLISVISSLLIDSIIKIIINRPRPVDGLVLIYKHLSDKSFPSGHTVTYTVLFGLLIFYVNRKVKKTYNKALLIAILSLPILLIGISRIYLGAHWASDVLGGYLLGSVILSISIFYYHRFRTYNPE